MEIYLQVRIVSCTSVVELVQVMASKPLISLNLNGKKIETDVMENNQA